LAKIQSTARAFPTGTGRDCTTSLCGAGIVDAGAAVASAGPPPNTTLSASPGSIAVGGTLTATWSGIAAPTPMDWIGFYVPGAPEASYFDWIFVSCSKVPSVALAAGSCSFTVPNVPPGTYELRLFANNSATLLATSNSITVTGTVAGTTLAASPASVSAGSTLTATWSGIQTPSTLDWIGFYAVGDAPNANPIDWMFTNCSKTQNLVGSSGTCPLTIPNASPGNYELRLYSGFNLLATSNSITVTGTVAGTTLAASPASISAGNTLTATWSGIPAPTPMDWIGLYVPGAPEASYFDWIFVSCSKVASVALAAGSCPFTIPNVPPGTYELRMYANNSASLLGISSAFTITP